MLAVVFNPLLYALRGTRNGFTFITSKILRRTAPDDHAHFDNISKKKHTAVSPLKECCEKMGK